MAELAERLQAALGAGYRIERELGGGGMSRVFVAEELELGRKVVVKVLPPEMALGVNADRFRREIQLSASLQHPHIVPLLSAGHSEDLVWYTMPLIEGESLRAKLAREGELPVPEALRLLRDVADALAYAHEHGVVHRDIKPDNVLIAGRHAVVTDFGVSKAITAATGATNLTSVGIALGTPAYMAPEQAAGSAQVDYRADIYALGAVAYELLTGRPPFVGLTPEATLAAHVTQTPDPLSRHRAAVPGAVSAVVMRCLEKKPADRWQTSAELHMQLEALATPSGGMTPTGAVPAFVSRLTGRRARSRLSLAAALVAVVALAYGGWRLAGSAGRDSSHSVAVLTFETIGVDTGAAYLAEGLADGISTSLSGLSRLKVVSRTAVRGLTRVSGLAPARLGEMLGVANLVGGSIQRAPGHLRVTVELVRAQSGEQVWTSRYDTTAQDILGVQTAIAEAVASAVAGRLLPAERTRVARRPTTDPEAYDHYLRGNRLLWKEDEPAVLGAIAEYEAALRLDSMFTAARGRLAYAYGLALNYAYHPGGLTLDSVLARGLYVAGRALAEDSSNSEAWLGRGLVLFLRGQPPDLALAPEVLRRAVTLDPSNDAAHNWYAVVLRRLGRLDESEQEYYRALAINAKRIQSVSDLGFLGISRRSYQLALQWYDRSVGLDSSVQITRQIRARAMALAGNFTGAVQEAATAVALSSASERGRSLAVLAEMEYRASRRDAAIAHFRQAMRELYGSEAALPATIGVRNAFEAALAAVALGKRELAIQILERTRPRGAWLWSYLIWEGFDPIRSDPRFRKIIDEARPPGAKDPV
jgi:TolB-like protein/tetratricopeptide (TPR) repeat protein